MAYVPINFVDGVTPLNAATLNHLEDAIEALDARPSGGGGAELVFEGDYVPATTYQDGDYVMKDGVVYVCVGGPTTTPPDSTLWPNAGTAPASAVGYGTSLPASPVNGQEHILVDNLTAPTYSWRFRFNANATGPYKWEFVGGTPLAAEALALYQSGSTAYVTPGDGPSLTIPRIGVYVFSLGLRVGNTVGGQDFMSLAYPGVAASDADAVYWDPVGIGTFSRTLAPRTLTTAGVVAAAYRVSGGNIYASHRWVNAIPVRVA